MEKFVWINLGFNVANFILIYIHKIWTSEISSDLEALESRIMVLDLDINAFHASRMQASQPAEKMPGIA